MRPFLRHPDDFYDGTPMEFPGGEVPNEFMLGGIRWLKQVVKCGTTSWVEFWPADLKKEIVRGGDGKPTGEIRWVQVEKP